MRIPVVFVLLMAMSSAICAQNTEQPPRKACTERWLEARTELYQDMFEADRPKPTNWTASVRIIIDHPFAEPRMYQILKMENGAPYVIAYELRKDAVDGFVDATLRNDVCADLEKLTKNMPVKRKTFSADKKFEALLNQVFRFQFTARPTKDLSLIHLDSTSYDLEIDGEDWLKYSTIDRNSPIAKWMLSVADTIDRHP